MLHHVPTAAHQDRIFAEAFESCAPAAPSCGSDSQPGLRFRILHFRDTMNTLDPAGLPTRLKEAGFTDVSVDTHPQSGGLRFRARRP